MLPPPPAKHNTKMAFSLEEEQAAQRLIELALAEDLGTRGDLTSRALLPPDAQGRAVLVARGPGVLAGLPLVDLLLRHWPDPPPTWQPFLPDGRQLRPGDRVGHFSGNLRAILGLERIALNFLQHLSGIATRTRRFVDAVAGLPVQVLDTRKTLPGWRLLAKYAVRQGGGTNHRLGLFDGFLIKDNHLAGLPFPDPARQIEEAVRRARASQAELERQGVIGLTVEIEVDRLDQLEAALVCKPDIILLDNMTPDTMRKAVRRRDAVALGVLLEASGGVTFQTIRASAEAGVDRISVGGLTHSAPALDLALDYEGMG